MHALLKRQLTRHFGEGHPPPLQCAGFISAVNDAYEQADTDREMLERCLELSSQELIQVNLELRRRNAELEAALAELQYMQDISVETDRLTMVMKILRRSWTTNAPDHIDTSLNDA